MWIWRRTCSTAGGYPASRTSSLYSGKSEISACVIVMPVGASSIAARSAAVLYEPLRRLPENPSTFIRCPSACGKGDEGILSRARDRPRQARRSATTFEADFGSVVFDHLRAGRFESRPRLWIAGGHDALPRCDREHVRAHRVEL